MDSLWGKKKLARRKVENSLCDLTDLFSSMNYMNTNWDQKQSLAIANLGSLAEIWSDLVKVFTVKQIFIYASSKALFLIMITTWLKYGGLSALAMDLNGQLSWMSLLISFVGEPILCCLCLFHLSLLLPLYPFLCVSFVCLTVCFPNHSTLN